MRAALVLLTALAYGCGAPPERSQADNIVLIVMDTVRVDHLSAYGYSRPTSPYLEQLATEGTRYERAWSTSSWTLPAHASMFTGLLPAEHGATQSHLHLRGRPVTLAQQLADAGYQTAGFSNNPWVSQKTGLERGFEDFAELWRKQERPMVLLADPSSVAVERWLERERDPERPFFLFVNLMEAHGPYEPDWRAAWPLLGGPVETHRLRRAYAAYDEPGLVRSWYVGDAPVDPDALTAAADLYDAEILQVDGIVERIVRAVDRVADPSHTTVLVVSDHGEAFGEHGHVGHAFQIYDTLLRVAAIGRGPGFEPGRVEAGVVQLTDVYPTVLSVAGLDPGDGPGQDLRHPVADRILSATYAYPDQVLRTIPLTMRDDPRLAPYLRSLHVGLDGRHKLILDSEGREEVYDLAVDPGETDPLLRPDPAIAQSLRAAARAGIGPGEASGHEGLGGDDDETEQALRELGYLE